MRSTFLDLCGIITKYTIGFTHPTGRVGLPGGAALASGIKERGTVVVTKPLYKSMVFSAWYGHMPLWSSVPAGSVSVTKFSYGLCVTFASN